MRMFQSALIAALLVAVLPACQTTTGGQDVLQHGVPPGWGVPGTDFAVGSRRELPGRYAITEWVRRGETVEAWSELITSENWNLRFIQEVEGSVGHYLAKQRDGQQAMCPGRTRWTILDETATDITYEVWFEPCPALGDLLRGQGNPAMARVAESSYYEIARIFDGTWNRFRLAYAAMGDGLTDADRARWIGWLKGAGVVEQ